MRRSPIMLDLALRPTTIKRNARDSDFAVIWTSETFGARVGRIRLADERTPQVWDWHINPPIPIPPWGSGTNTSLYAAKIAFRKAFERFAEQTTDEQWRQCFETQGAS